MQWTSLLVMTAFLAPASDGFFFGSAPSRRRDRPPIGRRRATWQPRPYYWDWTWNRPYSEPSSDLRRFHHSRLDQHHTRQRSDTDQYPTRQRSDTYRGGSSFRPAPAYPPYTAGGPRRGGSAYYGNPHGPPSPYRRNPHGPPSSYYAPSSYYRGRPGAGPYRGQPAGRRTDPSPALSPPGPADAVSAEGSSPLPERVAPPPALVNATAQQIDVDENITEEEKAHNYMKNTELLVKIATHFDTYGCFRRLVCECEYYSSRLSPEERTLEEKLILHVFGMERRRREGDMDRARFYEAAAVGEAARTQGLPDPCSQMAPKCQQNMVKKLWTRHTHGSR
ncbi:uncharacterized protein LOC122367529 [Amphibalanus amphitrite]|uniref:uncharacterized protein LOC122367529 n=1 Tax=Amphibalanus amphitrite TaxID=1232801 RepID=UPI001C927254|nr:uncharacterized protein LOC122367529 [Amphibalanus amphitrite]